MSSSTFAYLSLTKLSLALHQRLAILYLSKAVPSLDQATLQLIKTAFSSGAMGEPDPIFIQLVDQHLADIATERNPQEDRMLVDEPSPVWRDRARTIVDSLPLQEQNRHAIDKADGDDAFVNRILACLPNILNSLVNFMYSSIVSSPPCTGHLRISTPNNDSIWLMVSGTFCACCSITEMRPACGHPTMVHHFCPCILLSSINCYEEPTHRSLSLSGKLHTTSLPVLCITNLLNKTMFRWTKLQRYSVRVCRISIGAFV